MKRIINTLEALCAENATLTANRIAFIEIVADLTDKLRKSEEYKQARGNLFDEKGNAHTELSQALMAENYGYSLMATYRKESTRVDWKAYALALGGTEEEAKAEGYTATTAGSTAIKVKKVNQ